MCTAATYASADHYFGRNLDIEFTLNESVTVIPRNYPFVFRHTPAAKNHHAFIGISHIASGYPLFYDAVNEQGLSMAGLRFTDNLYYPPVNQRKKNIAPFEFIPWIMCRCSTVLEAENLIKVTNIANIDFSAEYPAAPLHWMISDKYRSIVIECTKKGTEIYENPVGILTNNPSFPMHLHNLNNYMSLTADDPENRFSSSLELDSYSRGMGAIGLPGDFSSMSRFVRAAFVRHNSVADNTETSSVAQFFHILSSAAQYLGCVKLPDNKLEFTRYSCCMNTGKGIYYYKTYENSSITAVSMHRENLDGSELISYPLVTKQQILQIN